MSIGHDRRRIDPEHPGRREKWPNQRSRKNLRECCRGKPGRLHTPEIVKQQWAENRPCREPSAQYWWPRNRGPWICWHRERCSNCGKVTLASLPWWLCPELPDHLRKLAPSNTP